MTFISRILGFLRDMIVAHVFGATLMTDAFYVAFKIPNLFRRLFAEGSFSQAFVPVLSEYKIQRTPEEMRTFINHLAGNLALILFIFTAVCMVLAPFIVDIFAPGFANTPEKYDLASTMLRITFPYLFFISLTAFAGAILNTHSKFAAAAFNPVLLNIAMIIAALWGAKHFHVPIYALAWGVFFAGIIQLLFLLPHLYRLKVMPRPQIAWHDPGVKRVLKLMVPALFGVSLAQISILVDTMFASFLVTGSISWLYNSERLMEFPLGIFGVALSTVILPHLSKRFAAKSETEYSNTIEWAIRAVLVIGLPAMLALIILAGPMLATLLNYGKFNAFDVIMTERSLMAFSIGIPFFMLVKIFAASFYARQNVKTPVKIAAIALGVNIALNFALVFSLKHAGLALASSIAAIVNAGSLYFLLRKQKIYQPVNQTKHFVLRIVIANIIFAIVLFFMSPHLQEWLAWRAWHRVGELCLILCVGLIVYFVMLWLLRFKVRDFITKS